jgi:hypothetical protein
MPDRLEDRIIMTEKERLTLLIAGRMAMHWPLQCPMCPDRAAMALDIAETILADRGKDG